MFYICIYRYLIIIFFLLNKRCDLFIFEYILMYYWIYKIKNKCQIYFLLCSFYYYLHHGQSRSSIFSFILIRGNFFSSMFFFLIFLSQKSGHFIFFLGRGRGRQGDPWCFCARIKLKYLEVIGSIYKIILFL